MSTLCQLVAPLAIRVRFTGGARPFELAWDDERGSATVTGATLEAAVSEATRLLFTQRAYLPVTEPAGDTGFAEAMRELIERTPRSPSRPHLRLVVARDRPRARLDR